MKSLVQKITQMKSSLQLHKNWPKTEDSGEKFIASSQVHRREREAVPEETRWQPPSKKNLRKKFGRLASIIRSKFAQTQIFHNFEGELLLVVSRTISWLKMAPYSNLETPIHTTSHRRQLLAGTSPWLWPRNFSTSW